MNQLNTKIIPEKVLPFTFVNLGIKKVNCKTSWFDFSFSIIRL